MRISIHVLREEDDSDVNYQIAHREISIHVLREEDDKYTLDDDYNRNKFQSTSSARRTTRSATAKKSPISISIHVLREEDDKADFTLWDEQTVFQSTSSARRTTRRTHRTEFAQ